MLTLFLSHLVAVVHLEGALVNAPGTLELHLGLFPCGILHPVADVLALLSNRILILPQDVRGRGTGGEG